MKKMILTITILLFLTSALCTAVTVDFYSDATIGTGDVYDTVNIYDSLDVPPVQTTVDMTGGQVSSLNIYDTANFNFNNGNIAAINTNNTSIARIYADWAPTVYLYNDSQIHLYNGGFSNSAFIYDNAQLHIYGYNLEYDELPSPNWVAGQWESGQEFTVYLRNVYSYDPTQVFLHEIPEPVTLLLFVGLIPLIRTKRNNKSKIPAV